MFAIRTEVRLTDILKSGCATVNFEVVFGLSLYLGRLLTVKTILFKQALNRELTLSAAPDHASTPVLLRWEEG
jgi:hypothetical protein